MIEQLKILREFVEAYSPSRNPSGAEALAALTKLEAMVGEQEPVAWMVYTLDGKSVCVTDNPADFTDQHKALPLYTAAPVAKQYEAGDMASAAAQGFRDGQAAQRAQRPDFHDMWAGYLKDGETPFERFMRERKDLDALTKLYQRALEENERLKAQQPQAEAVPAWTTEQITAVAQPIAMAIAENCRTAPQLVFPHLFLGLKDLLTSTAPQQAEVVPPDVVRDAEKCSACIEAHAVLDADQSKIIRNAEDGYPSGRNPKILTLAERVSALCTYAADWKRWCTEKDTASIANQIDRGVVVSFAVDRWLAEVANRPLVNVHRRTLDDTWRQVIRRFGGDPEALLGPSHDELAAIAQQKGGV